MIDWLTKQFGRIKTGAILVLIVLFALSVVDRSCNRQRITELSTNNAVLDTENYLLANAKEDLQKKQAFLKRTIERYRSSVKSIQIDRDRLDLKLQDVSEERDRLKDEVLRMAKNDVYNALLKAYPFPGIKKYPFNDNQIVGLYVTHEEKKFFEKETELLYDDLDQCDIQLDLKDSIILAQLASMEGLEGMEEANQEMILNYQEKDELSQSEIRKLKRSLIWHKIGAGLAIIAGVAIAL